MLVGLLVIFVLVLALPLMVKRIEENLEIFLFAMGVLAATISGVMNQSLFLKGAIDPIKITVAVLVAGLLFRWLHTPIEKTIKRIMRLIPFRVFIGLCVILLGAISSLITAIIAALVLVVVVSALRLERKEMVRFVVLACFSIGLGASLTPIGEPLSTIAISKLNEDFFFLIRLIGAEVFIALFVLGLLSAILVNPPIKNYGSFKKSTDSESYEEIFVRALKILLCHGAYVFRVWI